MGKIEPPKPPKTRKAPKTPTISRRAHNEATRMIEARDAREEGRQELGIGLRSLFLCGLPLRPLQTTHYKRTCGLLTLRIVGNSEYGGVPYGQDRLLPIWMATAFVHLGCPQDNTIRFVYARDILRTFDLPLDGVHYKRLREGFLRFHNSLFTLTEEIISKRGRKGIHCKNLPLLREARLWQKDPENEAEERESDAPHTLTLDHSWANEIREHPVLIDLQTVRALRTHPGALDFYQWQAWRSFFAQKTIRIPLGGPSGLFSQLGCLQDQPDFELRRRLKEWHELIKFNWPTCPNSFSPDGEVFLVDPGKAVTESHQNRFVLRGFPGTPK